MDTLKVKGLLITAYCKGAVLFIINSNVCPLKFISLCQPTFSHVIFKSVHQNFDLDCYVEVRLAISQDL